MADIELYFDCSSSSLAKRRLWNKIKNLHANGESFLSYLSDANLVVIFPVIFPDI